MQSSQTQDDPAVQLALKQLLQQSTQQYTQPTPMAPNMPNTFSPTPGPLTPAASTSSFQPPQAGRTSSGRVVKAPKPFVQTSNTPNKQSTPRASTSSANTFIPPTPATKPNREPFPLSNSPAPVLPLTAIADIRYQAMHTTFPTRMRLGVSSLMQPSAAPVTKTNLPSNEFAQTQFIQTNHATGTTGKRQRQTINYAQMEGIAEAQLGVPTYESEASLSGQPAAKKVNLEPWGDGKSYLGVLPPGNLVVVQPSKGTKHVYSTEDELQEQAESGEVFVPIQIELDVDTFKIRDAFVWNLNEKLITPESFGRIFCDDLDIPPIHATEIAKQIREQCQEQNFVAEIPTSTKQEQLESIEKDLRVILNLDVQIGTLHLSDKIEWDLTSSLTPELFAAMLVKDLSLPSSALPLISHALHEQILRLKKNCLELGLIGRTTAAAGTGARGAKALQGVWREWNEINLYGPRVQVLSLDEMDKRDAERERAIRKAKREKTATTARTARRR